MLRNSKLEFRMFKNNWWADEATAISYRLYALFNSLAVFIQCKWHLRTFFVVFINVIAIVSYVVNINKTSQIVKISRSCVQKSATEIIWKDENPSNRSKEFQDFGHMSESINGTKIQWNLHDDVACWWYRHHFKHHIPDLRCQRFSRVHE